MHFVLIHKNLYRLRTIAGSVYLLLDGPDAYLIDSGYRIERRYLLWQLNRILGAGVLLKSILLTHAHPDHDGNARFLRDHFGAELCMHESEKEYALNPNRVDLSKMEVLGWFARFIFRTATRLTPTPPLTADRYLSSGETYCGYKVIATPGHTPGSASYLHEGSKTLFCGDALLNAVPPWTLKTALSLPAPAYTTDMQQATRSLQVFLDQEYDILCAGHGPVLHQAKARVKAFLKDTSTTG